jgi:hypothetical protein
MHLGLEVLLTQINHRTSPNAQLFLATKQSLKSETTTPQAKYLPKVNGIQYALELLACEQILYGSEILYGRVPMMI